MTSDSFRPSLTSLTVFKNWMIKKNTIEGKLFVYAMPSNSGTGTRRSTSSQPDHPERMIEPWAGRKKRDRKSWLQARWLRLRLNARQVQQSPELTFFYFPLYIAGLGNHQPSGLCRARVSKNERVGRRMGERRLPCVQLFPKVRLTFLRLSLFIHTSALFARVYILPDKHYSVGSEYR